MKQNNFSLLLKYELAWLPVNILLYAGLLYTLIHISGFTSIFIFIFWIMSIFSIMFHMDNVLTSLFDKTPEKYKVYNIYHKFIGRQTFIYDIIIVLTLVYFNYLVLPIFYLLSPLLGTQIFINSMSEKYKAYKNK